MSAVGSFAGGGGRASGLGRLLKKLNYPSTVGLLLAGLPSESYVTPTVSVDLTTWSATGTGAPVGGQPDPVGGTAAYLVTEDASTGNHYLYTTPSNWSTNAVGYFAFYLKQASGSRDLELYAGTGRVVYNLTAGSVTTEISATGTIDPVAGYPGWWLCTMQTTAAVAATVSAYLISGGSASYTGDGASALYMYGPAVSQAGSTSQAVNPFYQAPAAVARTVDSPSDISNATYWSLTTGCTTPDTTTLLAGSDGSATAHSAHQSISDLVVGERCTIYGEFWAGTDNYVYFFCGNTISNGIGIDLSSGTKFYLGAYVSDYTITPLGGGHYGVSIDVMEGWAGAAVLYMQMGNPTTHGATFTGTGTESIHGTSFSVDGYPPTSPKNYIQTADQSTFANMFLRDQFTSGRAAWLGSAAAGSFMTAALAATSPAPWLVVFACNYVASGTSQSLLGHSFDNSVLYIAGADNTPRVYNGAVPGNVVLGAAIADGEHLIAIGNDGAGTYTSWVDDASTPHGSGALASFDLQTALLIGEQKGGVSIWNDRIGAIWIYQGSDFASKVPNAFAVLKALESF